MPVCRCFRSASLICFTSLEMGYAGLRGSHNKLSITLDSYRLAFYKHPCMSVDIVMTPQLLVGISWSDLPD